MRAPHPGEYIREDILPALGMTIKDVADHLGVTRVSLSELVNERRSMSLQMAQRCAQAFGSSVRFWMTLQLEYDLSNAGAAPRVDRLSVDGNNKR